MMALEEMQLGQICSSMEGMVELGQLKQKFSPEKWQLFRYLMCAYLNGMEAGAMLGQDEQAQMIG